jgi:glyoxylase-like metal-dependent hydrolase (beta-lactamase superfamily II)
MGKKAVVLIAFVAFVAGSAAAQDARRVLEAAAAAMGAADMKSIQYSGTGWQGALGQNFSPDQDWPRFELASYTRTIDFDTHSSKEEMVRRQGNYVARGGGGTPIQGEQRITRLVSGNFAWDLNPQGGPVPQPTQAELRQLEIWLTPHGFIKGALASNPTAVTRHEYDQRVTVVSFMALGKYRVNGTINAQNLVQRTQTWVPNPVVGDLYYENVYSNYRDMGGIKIPGRFHQHQDYDDGSRLPNTSGGDHTFGLETITDVKVNVAGAALTVPDAVRQASIPPVRVESEKLADGVWLIGGGSHNSVLVEFRDSVAVIEAPLNEERSLAVIAEVYRLVPNKPIRYVVSTHHHWDHLGGIRTYAHEGATVIMQETNRPYYQEVLTARPWTLKPDRYSMFPPEEWAEGYTFETVREKYILGDETRLVELHNVQGLQHALGMLIAYLPKEGIVVQADLYNAPAQGQQPPAAPNASNRTFYNNLQRLKLNPQTIVGIHGRPGPISGLAQLVSRGQ